MWQIPYPIRLFALLIMSLGVLLPTLAPDAAAQDDPAATGDIVYVVPIQGTIEPGIGAFLERSLDEAADAGATYVVLDINTPGGRLDTVLQMRDMILGSEVPVVAWVNREAFSAGALITIASERIYMAPAGVFGAATPVLGGTGETADAKTVSAVRSTFRATAEETGRDPAIAEAMVDPAVVIDGLDSSTTLLTLTTDQALQWDYADGVAGDLPAVLDALGVADAAITEMRLSPIEQFVRWITDPVFASLLITGGLFLIIADALFAGFGVAALAGVACLGLFFWGHLLAGFAGWEDLLLIVLGIVLIGVEIFVIPGFGIAGISGIVALAAGLILSMTGRGIGDFEWTGSAVRAGWSVAISLGLVLALLAVFSALAPRLTGNSTRNQRGFGWLALAATVDDDNERTPRKGPAKPGWVVRMTGGQGVLERGDLHMPDGPSQGPGSGPGVHRD
jgi:membrane-bound serine protease (ClpP class)